MRLRRREAHRAGPREPKRGRHPVTRRRAIVVLGVLLLVGTARWLWTLDAGLAARTPSHLILDRAERQLGEVPGSFESLGFWPLPATLPEKLVVTTLQTEDRHFNEHPGVHLPSVLRAAWQNARNHRVISGASTLAMQVARLQHPKARTPWGKLREAAEALLLVHRHGRDAVLRQYLTIAPYGNRCHGAVRAARLYFDKPIEDLSWLQAAYLAALPQQPGRMGPWKADGHAAALRRARRILGQLRDRGVIGDDDLHVALSTDLAIVAPPRRHPEALHVLLRLAKSVVNEPGVMHRATVDLALQQLTHRALRANLNRWRPNGAGNTAGVVVDLPTGQVLAYVGSADYFDPEQRGAIDYLETRRSPGSALKPFIYGLALEKGTFTAASELADTPVEFEVRGGGAWTPENMTHTFLGPMLLRQALGNSRNIPALRVLSAVGVAETLERLGRGGAAGVRASPDAYGLTLAIGGLHVTPMELAGLYTALANRGQTIPLLLLLDAKAPLPVGQRVLSHDAAMLVADILADPEARRPGFPVGGALDFDYAVAIKTGTSQGYRDAWAAAFSDRLLVVTWVGNHDWKRMNLASGATAAAPAAHQVMSALMPRRAPHQPIAMAFPLPPTLVSKEVCALSGRVPGPGCTHVKSERFVRGTEPFEACPFHVDVALDARNGLLAGPACPRQFVSTRPMLVLPGDYAWWASRQHLVIAPTLESPLCPTTPELRRQVSIREPRSNARYLFDPDTPRELSTVRLVAAVTPANEEVVWLIDGVPIAQVGWPHELRWRLTRGTHVLRARLAHSADSSAPVTIVVDD